MEIGTSRAFESVLMECGREFVDAIRHNRRYRDSWWDMKFAPSTCKYNMFGVTVLPGIFQWIVATKWAEEVTQTNGNGGVFARGAASGTGLQVFQAFFPFPLESTLTKAPGSIKETDFSMQIGFYEKKRGERNRSCIPEMNMEFKVVSKAKGADGRPACSYVMNLHVTGCVDASLADSPTVVFQDFGFTLTDPSGNATTVYPEHIR